jgi:hypothetical protein
MIALPQKLPNVIWHNTRLVPLSEGWITESIEHSARNAGYLNWHLSNQVAKAIVHYLETDCEFQVLSVEALQGMIKKSLEGVGFPDVAKKSDVVPPRVSIYLPELAAHASYELLFYPMLAKRLDQAIEYQVRGVRLEGLRDCTKILDSALRWRKSCRNLSDDIINFSRAHLSKVNANQVELLIC